jgi:hypothetical protein
MEMDREMAVKFVLGGLVTLAVVDAAQAQLFRRRAARNYCCCQGYYSSGSGFGGMNSGYQGSYAYSSPVYTNMYATTTTAAPPYVAGYRDPNTITPSDPGAPLTNDKTRLRVEVPTADTKIWVDQNFVQSTGIQRSIDMPFTSTSPQKVTITAQWWKDGREVVRKKDVDIRGGQEATVTFTDADAGLPGERIPTNPPTPDLNRLNTDKP